MPRPRKVFGPNMCHVLDRAPVAIARELFSAMRGPEGPIADLSMMAEEADPAALVDHLADLDRDILRHMEDLSRSVVDLSEEKGATSLRTVVERTMCSSDIERFDDQLDVLCRSIWIFVHHPEVFDDARSFHTARRYREHGKLYSAFEVAEEVPREFAADEIDLENLSEHIRKALDLKARTSATAIDLPETEMHPPSVMVAVRHGGALSSIQDHRDDGLRKTLYYRPANEAILLYTPSLRRLEICATSYTVREKTSRTFAEVVLGQDLSKKPLAQWNYSLERFKSSLFLPLPVLEEAEILSAGVTELEMRPGSWRRRLLLQVTADDDIEAFATHYMKSALAAARIHGFSRIKIVVSYRRKDASSDDTETLALWVNSNNTSNVQNALDPYLRVLGTRLLVHWGVMEEQTLLRSREIQKYFEALLFLYEYPDGEIEGQFLSTAGVDIDRMQSAQLIERKSRQQIVLIEDDSEIVEAEIAAGRRTGEVAIFGAFGEYMGTTGETDRTVYRINRDFLSEIVLDALRAELGAASGATESDHIASFGAVPIGEQAVPMYLVRCLATHPKPELLDLEFRRRHVAGPGVVLSTGDTEIPYLGSNVVVPVKKVVSFGEEGLLLDPEALELAWQSGQSLVLASDVAKVIRHKSRFATLHVPGQPPLNLFAEKQVIMFERLVEATRSGKIDMRTRELMKDMASTSPSQLFSSNLWREVKDQYLTQARPKSWRLGNGLGQGIS